MSTEDGVEIGNSQRAAKEGIAKVVLSRIGMAAPGMVKISFDGSSYTQSRCFLGAHSFRHEQLREKRNSEEIS